MFTEGVREIFLEGAERYGWLANRDNEKIITIAKRMLVRGHSVEEVAETTELPVDTVLSLV